MIHNTTVNYDELDFDELGWHLVDIVSAFLEKGGTKENLIKAIEIFDPNDKATFEFNDKVINEINKLTSN